MHQILYVWTNAAPNLQRIGVIAHSNRSCRVLSVGVFDAVKIIREELNIPTLLLDCDHTDERVYSEAAIMQRIEAFLEMLG